VQVQDHLRATWLVVQKEVKVHIVHVRRLGGRGLISSLIHTLEIDSSSLGRRAHRLMAPKLIMNMGV
jgi:hypothetical protein